MSGCNRGQAYPRHEAKKMSKELGAKFHAVLKTKYCLKCKGAHLIYKGKKKGASHSLYEDLQLWGTV